MRTKLIRVVTFASLLLLATALVFGVRSYARQDSLAHVRGATDPVTIHGLYTLNGSVTFIRSEGASPLRGRTWYAESVPNRLRTWRMAGTLGFWADDDRRPRPGSRRTTQVAVPFWFVGLLAGVLPTWRVLAWRARRRAARPGFEVEPSAQDS